MSFDYDLLVLGAGPGGYVAAIRARQLGMSVAIVEDGQWGGVCLNVGCIPSKALLRNAEVVWLLRERERFGIQLDGEPRFDYGAAYRRSREVVSGRVRGMQYLLKKNGITQLDGWGNFLSPHTIQVRQRSGQALEASFAHAIIAAGATPRLLPGTSITRRVHTYREAILREDVPNSLLIVGGGPIGVELGYVYAAYGTKVTIVEVQDQLLPGEDTEIAAELLRQYAKTGISVHLKTRVLSVTEEEEHVRVAVEDASGSRELRFDAVLQAIGFKPRTEGYGLETMNVELTPGGAISVDPYGRTSEPHIFAIGDVTGHLMLAHVAEAMGMAAVETIAEKPARPVDYAYVPRAVYSHPQVASFGPTERAAAAAGLDVVSFKFPMLANGKAQAIGHPGGFVKLLANRSTGQIEAAHLIGPDVTELLPELTLARHAELTVEDIAHNIHAHPTLSETLKDAAHGALGRPINI